MSVFEWHAKQVLDGINREAREGILSDMIATRIPIQLEVSLETIRILTKKLMFIMNTSRDERCVMQSCAQIASLVDKTNEILSSSPLIAKAVKHVLILHPPQPEEDPQDHPKEEEDSVDSADRKDLS